MNLSALSFRDLAYVVAIADHLHFGKAATASSVSQPTLSAQLRKLEHSIGFDLFERTSRTVLLTARGESVVAQARVILDEGRRLHDIIHAVGEPLTGAFRLGLIATLGPYLTPLLMQPARERFSRMRTIFTEGPTSPLVRSLETGEIDALLAASPLRGPDLMELPLFEEDLALALPRHHRLASVPGVRLEDVDADELIVLSEGHCLRDQTLALCPAKPEGGRSLQAGGLETLRQMVGAGVGCALFPRLAAQAGARLDDAVVYRALGDNPPKRTISMFYRASFGRIREARALRDLVRDALHAEGAVTVLGRPSLGRSRAA